MAVPGKHLEFHALPEFQRRCAPVHGLRDQVIAHLRNQPHAGHPVAGPLWRIELTHLGRAYAVYFGRRRNSIGLTAVFALPDESAAQTDYERELKRRYR